MKAAVVCKPGQAMTIEDVSIGEPSAREVLIRTAFAGGCHSDLHFADGTYPCPLPYAPGHESSGIVEQVGAASSSRRSTTRLRKPCTGAPVRQVIALDAA